MARSTGFIKAERNALVQALEEKFGLTFKRTVDSTARGFGGATAGLSVSNKDMKTNALAHLLCNSQNFPLVRWLLADGELPEVPEEFQNHFGEVSILYAAGSAMRICYQPIKDGTRYCQRHPSKDAALMGDEFGMRFCMWAQGWRAETVGGQVGTSASLKEFSVREVMDDAGNTLDWETSNGRTLTLAQLQTRRIALEGLNTVTKIMREVPAFVPAMEETIFDLANEI